MTTEPEKQSNGYTMIPVTPATKEALAAVMPKSWSWDKCISILTEMWEKERKRMIKSGKPAEDNQTS
jgi:hypothetical protein